jgi:transglutaminase-like putative cysteine protease
VNPRRTALSSAEIALAALTVIVAISLERLFSDTSFLRELLILIVGSHVVAASCRRAGLSMAWSTPISGLALVVLGTAVFYPDASALIVPTRETVSLLGDDLREAWQVFSDDAAPVPPVRGFLVTTGVLVWYGVFLADWAAFRLRSPLEAVAPATAVFVFGSLLGVDRNQITHGLLFALGLLGVLVTLRAERQAREEVWVAGGTVEGVRTTLRVGATAGVITVIVAALIAPQLPGATAQPLLDITEINDGPETRAVLSPLVEVAAQLIEQTDLELFSVKVDRSQRDYWRLMALTTFEDEIWRRSSNFDEARGPVESDISPTVPTRTVTQEITIAALANIYLPAAYEVSNIIDDGGVGLEYETATGALVVDRRLNQVPRGYTYTIESQVPDYSPEDLPDQASVGLDRGFVDELTQLPADCKPDESTVGTGCWPPGVSAEAQRIVTEAGATTDLERVQALQAFFLDPSRFTYDLDVALEQSVDDMNTFLTIGRGYCQQFASTFAAMARSLGIPTRVAVGFTWGDWDEARQEYVISGKHAHAWPEVYFSGIGWIIFDPTPGRSRGYDSDITGLPEPEQYGANLDAELPGTEDPSATTTTAAPLDPVAGSQTDRPTTTRRPFDDSAEVVPVGGSGDDGGGGGPWGILIGLIGVLGIIGFVPTTQLLRRRRRMRSVAADPLGRGEIAWDQALDALRLLGLTIRADQTPHEFASVVERSKRDIGPVRLLANEITELRYSATSESVDHALAAQDAAAQIVRRCRDLVGTSGVLRNAVDPRTLFRPPPAPIFSR